MLNFLQSYQEVAGDIKNGTYFVIASWCIITINSVSRKNGSQHILLFHRSVELPKQEILCL